MKSKLEYASHKTSQIIFLSFLVLFCMIVTATAVNFFTQGALVDWLSRFDKTAIIQEETDNALVIGMAAPVTSVHPLNFEFQNRLALNNVYEGLVALDPSLQVKQALAITFGQLDDLTWEFRLREGVKFHNGAELSGNDVIKSFRSAMEDESSQLTSVLSNIDDIRAQSGKIQIITKKPDPTFLHKLATVYLYKEYENDEIYGTGPYVLDGRSENEVMLTRFEDYWGTIPDSEEVVFTYIQDKAKRLGLFSEGEIDILRNVPSPLG